MSKTKALTNFSQLSDANFSVRVNTIQSSLKNNQFFQQMYPPYNDLEQAVTAYNVAYTNSASRSKESVSIKNTQRQSLSDLLGRTASSINAIANGNRDILTTSGFSLTSETPPDKSLGQVTNFSIDTDGLKGTMITKCETVKNVLIYLHQYTKGNGITNAEWTSVSLQTSKHKFIGLESGEYYTFRICAVGSNNIQNVSNPISSFVI